LNVTAHATFAGDELVVARGGRGGDGVVAPSAQPQRRQQDGQRRARGGAAAIVEEVIVEDDDWKVDSRGTPGIDTSILEPSTPRPPHVQPGLLWQVNKGFVLNALKLVLWPACFQ